MDQGYNQPGPGGGFEQHGNFQPAVSRPFVDPQAAGEVDPSQYPQPKESTHKVRGRYDFIEKYFPGVTQEMLFAKSFYFFFFSAFGSLFPMMAIYFKQMAMSGAQTGILIGIRPFVEFLACPFWASVADKFRKGRIMLVASVVCWILFTLAIGLIQPGTSACVSFNGTHEILYKAYTYREKRSVLPYEETHDEDDTHVRVKRYSFLPPHHVVGKSPTYLHHVANYNEFGKAKYWVSPIFSSIVYQEGDIQKIFFLLILLVVIGEFFSSPAITLADQSVLNFLGDDADQYGKQRMFGSLGWGLAMFFVGIALDYSTTFDDQPCEPNPRMRNYSTCFTIFSVLMAFAAVVSTQFKFDYSQSEESMDMEEVKTEPDYGAPRPWNEPKIPMQQNKSGREKLEEVVGTLKTKVFAQTVRERPPWMLVLREFKTLRCSAFIFVAWWMGFGIGLIFAFLFWHLQDYGGTPTLFGIASIMNHISEICAYLYSFRLIEQIGHVKVLCLGLLGNVLRFLYIAFIENPWWVLPFECIQGITHAAVWAACCSYIAHNTPQHLRQQAQGVLQGIHHGIGRGCGAIFGGIFVNLYGTQMTFYGYGALSFIVLVVFVFINFYRRDGGFQPDLPPDVDPHQMADEGAALAPHGVPANPMPRAASTQHLDKPDAGASYGACTTNGMLDVQGNPQAGGGTNPFGGGGGGDMGGGGYNYSMNPGGVEAWDPNTEQKRLIGKLAWPFENYEASPLSPTDVAQNQEAKDQFRAFSELADATDLDNKKFLQSMEEAGDLGFRRQLLTVK